ncbi:TrkH family potassium uptake protein [Rhodobacteraceae bacterium D3-12]|nr:TrkH family potassium uptake protein [Rhodobacteraceae bacterium D3-12]
MSILVLANAAMMLLFAMFMGLDALLFPATRKEFFEAFLMLGALGGALVLLSWRSVPALSRNQAFLITSTIWLGAGVYGALPLFLWQISPVDAVFESFSGLTTTGATVLSGLEDTPKGILMWRALLQALGGVGFIVTGMALLPFLRTGGMQLFRTESSDTEDKMLTSVPRFAGATLLVYLGLILLCGLVYHLGGMGGFDAVTHALTTLSTGGFSNYDASFGHFESRFLQWACVLFMLLGGLPFAWYIKATQRGPLRSEQVVFLLKTLALVIGGLAIWLMLSTGRAPEDALRTVAFNVISVVTTTGYATEDFLQWGPFAAAVFFFLIAIGGCTGSTAGGVKAMRWIILFRALSIGIRQIRAPHRVIRLRYEGRVVPDDVQLGVAAFFAFFLLSVGVLAAALALCGLDFQTALSGALTALANVGPGVGDVIGPAGNFAPLDPLSKLLLAFGMYVGRLEMFTVYVLFSVKFWRAF